VAAPEHRASLNVDFDTLQRSDVMKTSTILWMVAALAVPSVANADDVTIRDGTPGVTLQAPGVVIERHGTPPSVRDEDRETKGAGSVDDNCRRTTVHKEDGDGRTTTIRKKECD